jgi:hypothetical protein
MVRQAHHERPYILFYCARPELVEGFECLTD